LACSYQLKEKKRCAIDKSKKAEADGGPEINSSWGIYMAGSHKPGSMAASVGFLREELSAVHGAESNPKE
jgi:hypothetical protein